MRVGALAVLIGVVGCGPAAEVVVDRPTYASGQLIAAAITNHGQVAFVYRVYCGDLELESVADGARFGASPEPEATCDFDLGRTGSDGALVPGDTEAFTARIPAGLAGDYRLLVHLHDLSKDGAAPPVDTTSGAFTVSP